MYIFFNQFSYQGGAVCETAISHFKNILACVSQYLTSLYESRGQREAVWYLEHLPTREVGMSQVWVHIFKVRKCVWVFLYYLKANF